VIHKGLTRRFGKAQFLEEFPQRRLKWGISPSTQMGESSPRRRFPPEDLRGEGYGIKA